MNRPRPGSHILFEDNHLLVAEKGIGCPVQANRDSEIDTLNLLKAYLKRKYAKPGNVFLGLVHRLDREVGGIMVFAKTSKAAARLSEQIRRRAIGKRYLAVVRHTPEPPAGTLRHWLLKDRQRNRVSAFAAERPGAKEAILEYRALTMKNQFALCSVDLISGRPHQIRVQFAHSGHPLYGDRKYYPQCPSEQKEIGLWSAGIAFRHPVGQDRLRFFLPPPPRPPWQWFDPELFADETLRS